MTSQYCNMMSNSFEHCQRIAAFLCCFCVLAIAPINVVSAKVSHDAQLLDWVPAPNTFCGGYYNDSLAPLPLTGEDHDLVHITGDETVFARHDTTTLSGNVLFQRSDESINADKAILYRDTAGKYQSAELLNNVRLRQPNTMVVANRVTYDFHSKASYLYDTMYRILMQSNRPAPIGKQYIVTQTEVNAPGGVLTAWGRASQLSQIEPGKLNLLNASYSTCPPVNPTWVLNARHITLDRNEGRGSAEHVSIRMHNVPVFYLPYINFPIDARRKTGFLWPSIGTQNGAPYLSLPYYWNMAPNYDMFITPTIFSNRGLMLADEFRYLHEQGRGTLNLSILPDDKAFATFQNDNQTPGPNDSQTIIASKNRLANASTTRHAFTWLDNTRYNEHWSSHINFSHTSDDYFLRDFGGTLNDITQNQLLQEGELSYQSQYWHVIGRMQAYQTLHPFNETVTLNQYRRFPQLVFTSNYPPQWKGVEPSFSGELTNFDIRKTPGSDVSVPVGQRVHVQPGISLPLMHVIGFIMPRIQFALSEYALNHTAETDTPSTIKRALPIFDIASGITLERHIYFGERAFKQLLEPQIYYTYIPYRRQWDIPLFDTTVNTPTYDQLFNYNRFSGLDRIGDANQVSIGVSTRLIDNASGLEKVKLGIGEIMYFSNRNVTLCDSESVCNDYPGAHANLQRFSPVTATLDYHIIPSWNVNGNTTWDPVSKRMNNSSIVFHYQQDSDRMINLGFNYVSNASLPIFKAAPETDTSNNTIVIPSNALKVTDISAAWPITNRVANIGRISHDFASNHLQNILYGLQYDTCCVTVRVVGNRTFLGVDPNRNNAPRYTNEFYIQLSLKGLGNIGNGNPQSLLNTINGYTNSQFG